MAKALTRKLKALSLEPSSPDHQTVCERYEANSLKWKKKKRSFLRDTFWGGCGTGGLLYWLGRELTSLEHIFMPIAAILAVLFLSICFVSMFLRAESFRDTLDNGGRCTWCGCEGMTYVDGHNGAETWKHRRKDGSKDNRFKNNAQTATFVSKYNCEDCNADTQFIHEASELPSRSQKVFRGTLIEKGLGKRISNDFDLTDTSV